MTSAPRHSISTLVQAAIIVLLLGLAIWLSTLHTGIWPPPSLDSYARIGAGIALTLWLLLSLYLVFPNKRTLARNTDTSAQWQVIYASQTGYACELAQHTMQMLHTAGQTANCIDIAQLPPQMLAGTRSLFIVSTTGEGDPPDPALAFIAQTAITTDLRGTQYAILALGDRGYEHYCAFGHQLDHWLRSSDASPLFELIEVDNAEPSALQAWQQHIATLTGQASHATWQPRHYPAWTLTKRQHVNPGSQGGSVFHLELRPETLTDLHWQAGDIAEILPPAAAGHADATASRDYSIASIPSEGHLALLVRLMHHPDGELGLGSGWLCHHAALGDTIKLRIRSNPNFHAPSPETPLILIGNGTGIAGLRAHIRARRAAGASRTWLLFGERSAAYDGFYDDELTQWLRDGTLCQLDRTWSRDDGEHRYIQHRLRALQHQLHAWLKQGAAVYVCGSQEGMAPGVDAVFTDMLGAEGVATLRATGRYRRDVY